jgi:hypothetical protein
VSALPGARLAQPAVRTRNVWLARLHRWHRIAGAVSLIGMLLFAATGFTLNHATQIEAKPVVISREGRLPAELLPSIAKRSGETRHGAVPAPVAAWARDAMRTSVAGIDADWSDDEVMVSLPRPGGDAWLRIDRSSGDAQFEDTDRGWIAYLNDLHKGRHAGAGWSLFIDVFAIACVAFSGTGLVILKFQAGSRPSTWPLIGLGVVIPVVVILLFIH